MWQTLIIVVAVAAVGGVAALVLQRRPDDAPTQPRQYEAPVQLDRNDFDRPDAPWLVAVFSSATCHTCGDVVTKAEILASDAVAVHDVEVGARPDLHQRYAIEGVPITVIADDHGVVVRSFIGPVSATHLWAAVAEARSPGTVQPCDGHGHDDGHGHGVEDHDHSHA